MDLHLGVAVALHTLDGLVLGDEGVAGVGLVGGRLDRVFTTLDSAHTVGVLLAAAALEGRRELDFDLGGGDACQLVRIGFGRAALLAEKAAHGVVLLTSER